LAGLPVKQCKVEVRLMHADEGKIAVEFNRKGGDSLYFYEYF